MQRLTKNHVYLTVLAALVLILAACAPSAPPTTESPINANQNGEIVVNEEGLTDTIELSNGEGEKKAVVADDTEAVAVNEGVSRPSTSPTAGSSGVNADGIPVGFTEKGNAYIGNLDAPVVIEEYSDFQCPFCQRFNNQAMADLKKGAVADGDAVIIFRDYPLDFHPQAAAAANAARCAGEQGAVAYWDMHDALFDNFGSWSVNDPSDIFIGYASDIGIETAGFETCVREDRYAQKIQADLQEGQQKGVRGTPGFLINGEILSGAQPIGVFTNAIARAKAGESIVEAPEPVDVGDIQAPDPVAFSDNAGITLGDANAPVTIVEFTDLQCPFCSRHNSQTLPAILTDLVETGRVKYIIKDLPLEQIHPQARAASHAARCAGEQDAYMAMHDVLFEQQQAWSGQANHMDVFAGFAQELGLNTGDYNTCMESNRYDEAIAENIQEATSNGVSGTPFFFVDGYGVINGAQPISVFNQVVELAEKDELVQAIVDSRRQQLQQQAQEQQQPQQPAAPSGEPKDVPVDGAFAIGDPNAPVTIVEFTDYQCPFCARHYSNTFGSLKAEYIDQGLVYYVFKDFPLSFHQQAAAASQAARCAGDQGQFVEMHDVLFNKQRDWSGKTAVNDLFVGFAGDLGLDTGSFESCLNSGQYAQAVQDDFASGQQLGVTGTPAFFVNGRLVSGAQPFTVFQTAINAELEN